MSLWLGSSCDDWDVLFLAIFDFREDSQCYVINVLTDIGGVITIVGAPPVLHRLRACC